MEEKDSYNMEKDLPENLIRPPSLSSIPNIDSTDTSEDNINNIPLRKSISEIFAEFVITSVTCNTSTSNEILETNDTLNDDIIILDIIGKTNLTEISWKVYKTYKQIRDLFNQTRKEMEKRHIIDEKSSTICKSVYDFTNGELYRNKDKVAKYIKFLFNEAGAKNCDVFREELSMSATSFLYENKGIKPFEGFAYKKAEPRFLGALIKLFCFCCERWNKRWILLKDDMICYLNNPNTLVGKNVYWFDENINISPLGSDKLEITNLTRSLVLKFTSTFERDLWEKEINKRIDRISEDITNNEYQSFTSQKLNCGAKWFVDGHDYFEYLHSQLIKATESVFITDWFLSPELCLKRPVNYNDYLGEKNIIANKKNLNVLNANRLMYIFYALAKNGVNIYILIFCEPSLALAINSLHTKRTLQYLHPNIKITRHPKGTKSILWSHHEKLVIIDQKIAFVGGLDLCWGRYDIGEHPITEKENKYNAYYYPGSDYINERQVDLHNVEKYYEEQLPRNKMPRMAWHDVHTMVEGPVVSDIVRHFVERWNDARFNRKDRGLVTPGTQFSFSLTGEDRTSSIVENEEIITPINQEMELQTKNYDSEEDEKFKKLDFDDINFINSMKVPSRINNLNKISDDDCPINDKPIEVDDLCTELGFKKNEIKKIKSTEKPRFRRRFTLLESMKNKVKFNMDSVKNRVKNKYNDYKFKHGKNKNMKLSQKAFFANEKEQKDNTVKMDFKIQALRSVCHWSIGKSQTERSILQGYYKLIDNAKHYIYIENQFFITKSFSENER